MRSLLLVTLGLVLIVTGFAVGALLPKRLDVAPVSLPAALPAAAPPEGMSLSVLHTGTMTASALSAYRGGHPLKRYESGMAVVLVRHPSGDFLIDTGFGREAPAHLLDTPALMRWMAKAEFGEPAADQLRDAGYDPVGLTGILLTHAHWDHVSGITDFPDIPVLVTAEEADFITSGDPAAAVAIRVPIRRYRSLVLQDHCYLGFERSLDIHGDGSLVLVEMAGHTPGSMGVFVTLPSGRRYFFVGDLVWAMEGLTRPAERPWIARHLVDHDAEAVRQTIGHVHQLMQRFPEIQVVPAHDARVHQTLPEFPQMQR